LTIVDNLPKTIGVCLEGEPRKVLRKNYQQNYEYKGLANDLPAVYCRQ